MSFHFNQVIIAGNLTRDPVIRFIAGQGGEKAVASFGIATNRRWRTAAGEDREEATFVDVEAWGRTAELVGQYLLKGAGAMVVGRLRMDSWDDKQTGQKRHKLVIVADEVRFTSSKREREGATAAGAPSPQPGDQAAPAAAAQPATSHQAHGPAMDDEPPF